MGEPGSLTAAKNNPDSVCKNCIHMAKNCSLNTNKTIQKAHRGDSPIYVMVCSGREVRKQ